ncbi:MAG TPA: ABC transporter permease [Candidatus Hydrogenedentes bacterium]|nr:ABC transporter permease [Candidatus Hydrogenedentota bacterium]HOV73500.1 ABC transporter permease [Candidatus Hydrogenedentota bacterium]HPC16142.1 ABC transporter permease [Candidatus Hydrogenedentota bacterium]HRT18900.1 ABC transporter permease [Candidatus Hydrogenedentota bacterium]HRT64988.1 ABC transporter permease [Candidatus Hydrogenedentota bacterium]
MNNKLTSFTRYEPLYLLFAFLGGMALLFIVAPLAGMALKTSGAELVHTARDTEVQRSIFLTVWTSMAATAIMAVGAIPLAYLLARKEFPLKRLVTAIIDLPIVIPHSAAGIAILGFVAGDSLIGAAGKRMGIHFVGGAAGIMAAMAFVSLPFLINAARDGFHAVPERLEKAALGLGASPARVFFTISVPLAWRAILSGLILMWARGLSEFGAVAVVAYHPIVAPVLIYERFSAFGLKYARPISVLFIGVCLILFIAARLLARRPLDASR